MPLAACISGQCSAPNRTAGHMPASGHQPIPCHQTAPA
jgi:hypothetical protein